MSSRTADQVDARIDAHEDVCAERYRNIGTHLATLDGRFDTMSNRIWAAAGAMLLLSLTGMGTLAVILLTMRNH